jgi:hypothetical protein
MKRIKLYISLLFIICAHNGLAQCIQNGDFADWCNEVPATGCTTTFTNTCVPNWQKSHGSPQLFPGNTPAENVMFMWAISGAHGEGVLASYNFQANHQYKIKVAAYRSTAWNAGNLVLLAANNVTPSGYTDCQGEDLPHFLGTYILMNQPLSTTMTEYTLTFTPLINYSQVWLYPSTQNLKVDMYVDYVSICQDSCTGYITYNSGAVPGGTTRAGFIYAGSSAGTGGSGTVTVQNGISTSFIGGDEVYLQPNFHAQLTSGEFRALIYRCYPEQIRQQTQPSRYPSVAATLDPRGLETASRSIGTKRYDSSSLARARPVDGMSIFPNPVRSKLSVRLNNFTGNIAGMQVLNEVGIVVQQIDRAAYADKQNVEIDVSRLPAGTFILKVITDKQTFTQKFQKMK